MFVFFSNLLFIVTEWPKACALVHVRFFYNMTKNQAKCPIITQQCCFDFDADILAENKNVLSYPIPEELEENYVSRFPSRKEAWIAYQAQKQPEYVEIIGKLLSDVEKDCGENVEGVLTFNHSPSLLHVCSSRRIPVIEVELAAVREPHYLYNLGYFLTCNRVVSEGISERYECFTREALADNQLSLLSRKEIIALTVQPDHMNILYDYNNAHEYDLGVAVDYSESLLPNAWISMGNDEMIKNAKEIFDHSLLLRPSPLEPDKADKYGTDIDRSPHSLDFVHRCKRIATTASNLGYEGMLLGKPVYMFAGLPFALGAMRTLDIDNDMVCSAEFINFITFCIFTPFEYLFDADYIRWRLTNPPELEIYKRNLNYILENYFKIDPTILTERKGRLNRILATRGLPPYHYDKHVVSMTSDEAWVKRQLAARDKEIFDLEMKLAKYNKAN